MNAPPHAFILAGGRGTRFWPLSTHERPKQFLDFTGEGSLLALTVSRLTPLIPPERQWILTGSDLGDAVREAVPQVPADQIIAEPCGRNTAPAIGLAAAMLVERGEDPAFAVLPSDHLITPGEDFRSILDTALRMAAERDCLITFGVLPTRAETGYGYIEAGTDDAAGFRRVDAFREKPELALAQEYLDSGRHLWNSGMFCWRASVVLDGLSRHAPEVLAVVRSIASAGRSGTPGFLEALESRFPDAPSISIDYALMENARNVLVADADFRWNDVGHWLAMRDLWPADEDRNAHRGELLAVDSTDNIVLSADRLTALIGMHEHVIVSTKDVTLVCPADRAQDVRLAIEALRDRTPNKKR